MHGKGVPSSYSTEPNTVRFVASVTSCVALLNVGSTDCHHVCRLRCGDVAPDAAAVCMDECGRGGEADRETGANGHYTFFEMRGKPTC